jgi:hypothetical protein
LRARPQKPNTRNPEAAPRPGGIHSGLEKYPRRPEKDTKGGCQHGCGDTRWVWHWALGSSGAPGEPVEAGFTDISAPHPGELRVCWNGI